MEFRVRGAQPGQSHRHGFELRFRDGFDHERGIAVKRFQRFDRREDIYCERIVDMATGEVVHEQLEPLSDHRGHGDARRPRLRG